VTKKSRLLFPDPERKRFLGNKKTTFTYGELIDGAGGLDVLQGSLEISELGLDLGGGELGTLKLCRKI